MTESRVIATIEFMDAYPRFIEMFRARIVELGTSYESIEAVAGLPDGYVAKMLSLTANRMTKKGFFGERTLGALMQAVGIKFVVMTDDNAIMRKLDKRMNRGSKIDDAKVGAEAIKRAKCRLARTKFLLVSSSKQRSMTARIAACARWQKHRAKQAKLARRRELRRKLMEAAK